MGTNDDLNRKIQKAAGVLAGALVKRYGMAHKMAIGKVAQHLDLAKAAHAKGMASLKKAAGCMVDAQKLGKAADASALAGHIASAHDHFNSVADHMDDMEAHLGKAMSAWGSGPNVDADTDVGGSINIPGLTELTEGDVPWYDSAEPYGEKVAKALAAIINGSTEGKPGKTADAGDADVAKALAAGNVVTKEQAEAMVKAAAESAALKATNEALQKQVETLSRQPAGAPRVRAFDFGKDGAGDGKGADGTVRLAKLIDGVDLNIQPGDTHAFTTAAGKMIANMISNSPKFGKSDFGKAPMWDPEFRGRAATGARN